MFRFQNIEFLYLLILLPLIWWGLQLAVRSARRRADLLGSTPQVKHMLPDWRPELPARRNLLYSLAFATFLIALANPQMGAKKEEVQSRAADVFVLMDISRSMLATDVPPSRLARARRIAGEIIGQLATERIGLITFAGNAWLHMPLTTDYRAAISFLGSADPSAASTQGTAIADAIQLALSSFKKDDRAHPVIVLISDGENHEEGLEAAREEMLERNVLFFAVGVGTEEGGPVPLDQAGEGSYLRDRQGEIVQTRFRPGLLQELANRTGGEYFSYTMGREIAGRIDARINQLDKIALARRSFSEYESYYQFPMAVGIVLLCLAWFWRRKWSYDKNV